MKTAKLRTKRMRRNASMNEKGWSEESPLIEDEFE
jgi:hypothetical protein